MAADIPSNEPSDVIAGRTWKWTRDLSDYPAGTWTLTYYFKNAVSNFAIVATAAGTTHSVSVAKATTAGYRPGLYDWQAIADNGTESYVADSGQLTVAQDFATAGNYDRRTHARKVLDAIEATLERRATSDQLSMSLGNRSISRIAPEELRALRDRYRQEVRAEERAERIANGGSVNNSVRVRF
jgi:hypothetical protein